MPPPLITPPPPPKPPLGQRWLKVAIVLAYCCSQLVEQFTAFRAYRGPKTKAGRRRTNGWKKSPLKIIILKTKSPWLTCPMITTSRGTVVAQSGGFDFGRLRIAGKTKRKAVILKVDLARREVLASDEIIRDR